MIATDLQSLLEEIRDWKKYAEPYLLKRKELVQHTAGPHYRDGEGVKAGTAENVPYTYKTFVLPQLISGRPVAKVTPDSPENEATAKALGVAIKYWGKETSQKEVFREVVEDCIVGFGVTLSGVCADPSYHGRGLGAVYDDFEQVPNYPFTIRVDPRCAIFDRRAKNIRTCRLIGHTYEQDLEDVVADPRNDPATIATLTKGDNERASTGDEATVAFAGDNSGLEAERRRITIHEIYLPEHKLLIAIAEIGTGPTDGVMLRQADFFGPDEGPFHLWGLGSIPGELLPCPPLMALWERILGVAEHSRAAADSAASHKKFFTYTPAGKDDAAKIMNVRPGEGIPVKDNSAFQDREVGGASQSQLGWIEYDRTQMEHDLGYGSAQQGVAGDKTATGEQIAAQNSDLRIKDQRDRIADCITAVYRKVAWYFHEDSNIAPLQTSVTNDQTGAVQAATMIPGRWNGGHVQTPGGLQYIPPEPESDPTDYHFEVEASSLVATDDAMEQKRAQDLVTLAQEGLQMGMPINIRWVWDYYGQRALGISDLSKKILLDQGQVIPPDPWAMGQNQLGPMPGVKPQAGMGNAPIGRGPSRTFGTQSSSSAMLQGPTPQGPQIPQLPMAGMLGAAQRVG